MGTADPSRSKQEAGGSPKASGPLPASAGQGPLLPLALSPLRRCSSFSVKGERRAPQLSAACGASTAPPLKACGAGLSAGSQLCPEDCQLSTVLRKGDPGSLRSRPQPAEVGGPEAAGVPPAGQPPRAAAKDAAGQVRPGCGLWSADSWLHVLFLKP